MAYDGNGKATRPSRGNFLWVLGAGTWHTTVPFRKPVLSLIPRHYLRAGEFLTQLFGSKKSEISAIASTGEPCSTQTHSLQTSSAIDVHSIIVFVGTGSANFLPMASRDDLGSPLVYPCTRHPHAPDSHSCPCARLPLLIHVPPMGPIAPTHCEGTVIWGSRVLSTSHTPAFAIHPTIPHPTPHSIL